MCEPSAREILLVDVGNTFVKTRVRTPLGVLRLGHVIPTSPREDFALLFDGAFDVAVMASVVPPVGEAVLRAASRRGIEVLEVTPDVALRAGIVGIYPSMGPDRIAAVIALATLYPLPGVCVDAGTAITLDVVGEGREYRGGLVAPGPTLAAKALGEGTALLAPSEPAWDDFALATDTAAAVARGVAWGSIAMVDGLLRVVRSHVGEWRSLVLTGGVATRIGAWLSEDHVVDADLVFKGMGLAWDSTHPRAHAR